MLKRAHDPEPVVCFVCRRAAGANGYAPPRGRNQPVAWVCDDPLCGKAVRVAYHMPVRELSQAEAFSLHDAGAAAGDYLTTIGETDLAKLDPEQWARFLKIVLTSYESAMRDRLCPKGWDQ